MCLCPVRAFFYPQTKTQEVLLCRVLSVDLKFRAAPKDLMTKFVDCLVRLPNLRTLEVFTASHIGPITRGLKRKCAQFTSVRELWISDKTVKFIGSCPNVESIIAPYGLSWDSNQVLCSYTGQGLGKLKRLVGVNKCHVGQGELRRIRRHQFIDGMLRKLCSAIQTSRRLASGVKFRSTRGLL